MRITKVYTRTGDSGRTRLAGGQEVSKDSLRVEAYGTVDELNASVGFARAMNGEADRASAKQLEQDLRWVQNKLFDLGGILATAPGQVFKNMPAIKAQELIDDFESASGRSSIDTLWVNSSDAGADASKMLFGKITREAGNHALSVTARMSEKDRPFGRVNVPLSRGAIEPVDAREFRGVKFDVRGDGDYRLLVPTYNAATFQAPFKAAPQWQTISIDFSSLKPQPAQGLPWRGDDLLMLSFEIARKTGELGWLEIDNVRFYR